MFLAVQSRDGIVSVAAFTLCVTMSDVRDRKLLKALADVHEQRCHEPIKVGVVYGAGHMPAGANGLGDRYRPRSAEWMTVCTPN